MADVATSIDIEGNNIICSQKELIKLQSPEGCDLNIVTEKVMHLDDLDNSDEEENFDEDPLNKENEIERMRREYVLLTLNANRDPLKPSQPARANKLFQDNQLGDLEEGLEYIQPDDIYTSLKRKYVDRGDYDNLLKTSINPSYEEVSPGRVFKRRSPPGSGLSILPDSIVIYNYALWLQGAPEPFDSTWLRRTTVLNDLETDSVLPGIYELLLTCKKGEWCEALIRPDAAFGQLGVAPRIPPDATIFCVLEVVRVLEKNKINILLKNPSQAQQSGVSFQDFYDASDEARMRGNYFLERKEFRAALSRYKSGIRIMEALTYKDAEEEKQALSLLMKLYNNSAKAANLLGDPRLALAACKQASMIEYKEPKTHWNRMTAWKLKGHPDRALDCALRALQIFGDPKIVEAFRREIEVLKKCISKSQTELENLYRLMSRAILSPDN